MVPQLTRLLGPSLCAAALLAAAPSQAQDVSQQTGWLAWFNSARLHENWGLLSDVQLRSHDSNWGVQNTLLRLGGSYLQPNGNQWTLGYAWIDTDPGNRRPSRTEHRYWQQYMRSHPLRNASLTHRVRLEQRDVEQLAGNRLTSHRVRYFARAVVPLPQWSAGGTGPFLALQNEVFLNVAKRENVNGRLFDQNRAYVAGGYRVSPSVDLEFGYLNQRIAGRRFDTENHVLQLAVYSRF